MTIKNGDLPATPTLTYDHGAAMNGIGVSVTDCAGLTKREIFAMHLMVANRIGREYIAWDDSARDAIEMADALLTELERTK